MKRYYVFFAILFLTGTFLFFQVNIVSVNGSGEAVIFHIEKGEGSDDIASHLNESGLIRSTLIFRFYVFATGNFHTLKAGDYELNSGMSMAEISQKIVLGDIAKKTLTIIEGWGRKEIAVYLEEQGIAKAIELVDPAYASLEGYLFPDTYQVRIGANLEEVVTLLKENFNKKAGNPSKETVIMASLIEKEVRSQEDKRMVTGILWKRLEIGMPLQVDATIAYITGKQNVSIADTKIDSPYNTYKYRGLPVGPIANPGLESIQATLNPQENPYLYYLSTPEGKTIFSKTLEEHSKAKHMHLR